MDFRYIEIRREALDSFRCKTRSIAIFLELLLGDSPNATRSFPLRDWYIYDANFRAAPTQGYMNISISQDVLTDLRQKYNTGSLLSVSVLRV